MTRADYLKILLNLCIGFLTVILSYILPIGSGGVSLVFVLTIPISVGFSIIAAFIYYKLAKKNKVLAKNIFIWTAILANLLFTLGEFPYA